MVIDFHQLRERSIFMPGTRSEGICTGYQNLWLRFTLLPKLFGTNPYKFFFFYLGFFHDHSRITRLQGKGEGIFLAPHYQFHLLHEYLDICRAIIADSFPLHIASSQTRTGNYWFPCASC